MPLSYATLPGDIDHLIVDDHAVVERLFTHVEAQRGDRRVLVDQITFELSTHATAEEKVLYPALQDAGMAEDSQESLAEHQAVKELLDTLRDTEPGEGEFESALTRLIAEVRHHVAEEESDILPQFRRSVGAEKLAELGKEFLTAKRHSPTGPHPAAPSSGLGHKLTDAAAILADKASDRLSGRADTLLTDASGLLNPEAQAIVDAHSSLHPLPFQTLTPEQARKQPGPDDAVKKVMKDRGIEGPEEVESVDDLSIPDGAGGTQTLRVYHPKGAAPGLLPVIMWIHGGGWVLFDLDTYDASCRGLANKSGAIVVSPDYRRAPEAVFPAAHDDVLAAYRWVAVNAESFGGDARRIGIGGESVGGNMAAATILQLNLAGETLPLAQVCVYPLTTAEQYGESMQDAADGKPLNRPLLSWMALHAFEGSPDAATDFRIDLLGRSSAELSVMPPTLVITDERDVLRSQGQAFAHNLQRAGVDVTSRYYEGVMHEFFGASAVLDEAEQAQKEAALIFQKAFRAGVPIPA